MKKKYLIYIPLILILIIQIFDKNDDFVIIQYILLASMIIALLIKLFNRKKQV
ncbi:hypothetical protein BXY80_0014 [Ichthyenterobacterium magnum]|uniref:Uncharacterized protein n=1 Tax=Ichthyenterobacterium magnum TaxID=1230530 RepID=A0A420DUU6_9FLAO|nr:hypothetical protein BXY80_0014 [Ichthyenterobacterium magnum]